MRIHRLSALTWRLCSWLSEQSNKIGYVVDAGYELNCCAKSTYCEGSHVNFNRGGTEDEPSEQLLVPHSHICSQQPTLEGESRGRIWRDYNFPAEMFHMLDVLLCCRLVLVRSLCQV